MTRTDDPAWVPYWHIPEVIRGVLDELFTPAGAELWWNNPNVLLAHYVKPYGRKGLYPRDYQWAAFDLANGIANGVFQ